MRPALGAATRFVWHICTVVTGHLTGYAGQIEIWY